MTTRTAIIKTITDNPPKKDGSKSISLVFEDDIFGVFGYKGDHGLFVNQPIAYMYEEKKSKKGNLYHEITSILAEGAKKEEAPKEKPPKNVFLDVAMKEEVRKEKYKASVDAMKFVVDYFLADKINYDKIKTYYDEVRGYLFDAIDDVAGS